jgi:peptidoglycan/LPS O-acetylase OafA/YrhL
LGSDAFADPGQLLKLALLLTDDRITALEVSWTLTYEMPFYLVFAVLM